MRNISMFLIILLSILSGFYVCKFRGLIILMNTMNVLISGIRMLKWNVLIKIIDTLIKIMRIWIQNHITKPCRINRVSIELIQNCTNICNYIFPICIHYQQQISFMARNCIFVVHRACFRSTERYEIRQCFYVTVFRK